MAEIHRFLDGLTSQPAATTAALGEAEKQLGVKLPGEYLDFLRFTNGGEGFIGQNEYIMLWSADELASMNQSYEVEKYAPGLLLFGSSGGGEAYGFDTRTPDMLIVKVPFVGMDWSLALSCGTSFNDFLRSLYEAE